MMTPRAAEVMAAGGGKISKAAELRRGWPVVLTAATGVCVGVTGLPFYSIGLMVKPLAAEFGWSRAALGGAALCLQLGIVLSAPVTGRLIDRFGLRRIALCSIVGFAVAALAVPLLIHGLAAYYAAWLALSLLGCGTTPLVWTRAVVDRFALARGLALGLTLLGTGIAGMLAPAVIGAAILVHGWRAGFQMLGFASLLVALPITLIFLRDPATTDDGAGTKPALPLRRLAADGRFRRLALAFLLLGLSITALIVHLVPLLVDRGLADAPALAMAAALGLAVMVGRVLLGVLVDRFRPTIVAFCFLMLPVASCMLLLADNRLSFAAVLLLGLAAGAEIDLLAYFVSRVFPLEHYGSIYGAALATFSLGAGFGPVIAGLSYDYTASYAQMLWLTPIVVAAGAWLVLGLELDASPAALNKNS